MATSRPLSEFYTQSIVNARDATETRTLQSLWSEHTVVLLFLRRLGCSVCRAYADEIRENISSIELNGTKVVALSFEKLGEGSDFDNSFTAGGYWTGPLYVIDKSVYEQLFGRKGFLNGVYGLFTMDREGLERANRRNIQGNVVGDGFVLGGQFVLSQTGEVLLDHRQTQYGDDASIEEIVNAIPT